MDNRKKGIGICIAAIVVISVLTFVMPVVAKDPLPTPNDSIAIDNSIININVFGETYSFGMWVWFYGGYPTLFDESPYMSYGGNNHVTPLKSGTVYQFYPVTGTPDVWYDAIVGLDLDNDTINDINVTRSIMVPSGQKYFLVRYCIENINNSDLENFRFFQDADYDVLPSSDDDEGGYVSAGDFIWAHDLNVSGTYVGFKGNRISDHHSVNDSAVEYNQVWLGLLNDAAYYNGDVAVALEWDLGTLTAGETQCLTVKFAFADSYDELKNILSPAPVPALTPTGLIALISLLSAIAAVTLVRKRR
jgi:hypothetical protein